MRGAGNTGNTEDDDDFDGSGDDVDGGDTNVGSIDTDGGDSGDNDRDTDGDDGDDDDGVTRGRDWGPPGSTSCETVALLLTDRDLIGRHFRIGRCRVGSTATGRIVWVRT